MVGASSAGGVNSLEAVDLFLEHLDLLNSFSFPRFVAFHGLEEVLFNLLDRNPLLVGGYFLLR